MAESYPQRFAAAKRPESFDKDFVRNWVNERCDPYKDPVPEIPREVVAEAARIYIEAYETITGRAFEFPDPAIPPLGRIRKNLARYFPVT
jgi:phosphoribosylaminoimidazole-succinocarboxamide synthase